MSKVAVITGGAQRIGKGLGERLGYFQRDVVLF